MLNGWTIQLSEWERRLTVIRFNKEIFDKKSAKVVFFYKRRLYGGKIMVRYVHIGSKVRVKGCVLSFIHFPKKTMEGV